MSSLSIATAASAGVLFAARSNETVTYLGILAGLLAVVSAIVYVVNYFGHRRRYNSHPALFQSLCRLHALDRSERALLKQAARGHRLKHPAAVFIDPRWLDPSKPPPKLQGRVPDLAAVRKRLFCLQRQP